MKNSSRYGESLCKCASSIDANQRECRCSSRSSPTRQCQCGGDVTTKLTTNWVEVKKASHVCDILHDVLRVRRQGHGSPKKTCDIVVVSVITRRMQSDVWRLCSATWCPFNALDAVIVVRLVNTAIYSYVDVACTCIWWLLHLERLIHVTT